MSHSCLFSSFTFWFILLFTRDYDRFVLIRSLFLSLLVRLLFCCSNYAPRVLQSTFKTCTMLVSLRVLRALWHSRVVLLFIVNFPQRASIEDWLLVKKTIILLLAIVVRAVTALVIAVSSA